MLTLDGMVELAVPVGTQPGAKLFLRGKGVHRVKSSGRGSQYVHLKVQVPRKLTPRQKELMEEFLAEEQTPAAAKAASSGGKPDATASFAKLCERTFAKLKGYLKPEEKKKDSKKDEKKESE